MKQNIAAIAIVALVGAMTGIVSTMAQTDGVTATVTATALSVAVTDGTVAYLSVSTDSTQDTTNTGVDNTQICTNDGSFEEDFNIMGQDSGAWELADTAAGEAYTHKSCIATCDATPSWAAFNEDGYTSLATDIAISGTVDLDLQIGTPETTSTYTVQSVDVTVQAVDST